MSENLTFTEFIVQDLSKGEMGKSLNSDDYGTILSNKEKIRIKKENFLEEIRIADYEDFIWIFLKQGTAKPRAKKVFNMTIADFEDNPRRKEQVELNKQSYLVIHKNSNRCFLSNLKKLDYFEEQLTLILSKRIGLTPLFKSLDEVTNQLKTLEEVTFVIQNDLFSSNDESINLFGNGLSCLGLDKPDELHIRAKFENNSNIASIINFFNKIKNIPSASNISCTCKDAKKLAYILNIDGTCRRIVIRSDRNEDGLYNDDVIVRRFFEEFKKCYG